MQSTKGIILENWQDTPRPEKTRKPLCHFALKQSGASLDFYLEQLFRHLDLHLHYFDSFESLITICQRYPVSVIMVAGNEELMPDIELLRAIKQNVFVSIIPVIMYHPAPDYSDIVAAYENGVEDFIYGQWRDRLVQVRIGRVIDRNRRDLAVNPTTHLPGPAIIEREVCRQLKLGAEFAVGYADLDNFKAYNDYYGYYRGDKVIKLTSMIIKDIVFDLCREGFVGHIAGDDFIFIIPRDLIHETCQGILRTFGALIPYKYDESDRARGSIDSVNRRGEAETFPLLTMSIAVLENTDGGFEHVGQMSKMLADLKKAAKLEEGNVYKVERRKKY